MILQVLRAYAGWLHGDFDGEPMPLAHAKKLKSLLEGAGKQH